MADTLTIEERVAILEKELAELKHANEPARTKVGWIENISGTFKNDVEFGEILRLGREIRKADTNGDS